MNGYRERVFEQMLGALSRLCPFKDVLDVGAGDGWFAMSMKEAGLCGNVTAIDINARPQSRHPIEIYDGIRLPFADAAFDLVYAVDVVHHARDPLMLLAEIGRCARRLVVLKDHTWRTAFGWLILAVRDEIGNRPNGVKCAYHFQHDWEWDFSLRASGFERLELVYPLCCHAGPFGRLANKNEFISIWQLA